MSSNQRKARKYRGSKTHGGGAMKKRRGAGSRGGRGRAGSGKRGDGQKPSFWKTWKMGKHGFTKHNAKTVSAINLRDVELGLASFEEKGFAKKSSAGYTVDLTKAGYTKLLASGQVRNKLTISVASASQSAIEKVSTAGGTVTVLQAAKEKAPTESAE